MSVAKRTAKAPASKVTAKPPAEPAPDFGPVFSALKPVLAKYSKRLFVRDDKPDNYYLETKSRSYQGERMFFAGLRVSKTYVSFHLMPLYTYPELRESVPVGLKQRMQGKSSFHFTAVEPDLIALLGPLVAAGFKKFGDEKLL